MGAVAAGEGGDEDRQHGAGMEWGRVRGEKGATMWGKSLATLREERTKCVANLSPLKQLSHIKFYLWRCILEPRHLYFNNCWRVINPGATSFLLSSRKMCPT